MIKDRIIQVLEYKSIAKERFYTKIGMTSANFRGKARETPINSTAIENILSVIPDLNLVWLITGNGEMLTKSGIEYQAEGGDPPGKGRKIPVFDIHTIGGTKSTVANMEAATTPSEWIDAGDWFKDATAAMHHYGDSMIEYPSGCILALREIFNFSLIVWGKAYVVETDEYRITKRLQQGETDEYIIACSTNADRYPDGKLIHSPLTVPVKAIRRLAMVLGYVVKEQSSGMIYNVRLKK